MVSYDIVTVPKRAFVHGFSPSCPLRARVRHERIDPASIRVVVKNGLVPCANLLHNCGEWQRVSARRAVCCWGMPECQKGTTRIRPELQRLLDQLCPGDVVIVWKLDRLSRSLKDLLHIMEQLERAGAGLRSLTEAIDTTTPAGRMLMQMVDSFAEFERAMIRERTQAGLMAARARGRISGRRPVLGPVQQAEIVAMVTSGRKTQAEAARVFKVHPATVSRLLATQRQQAHSP
jgi:hypothetical protein